MVARSIHDKQVGGAEDNNIEEATEEGRGTEGTEEGMGAEAEAMRRCVRLCVRPTSKRRRTTNGDCEPRLLPRVVTRECRGCIPADKAMADRSQVTEAASAAEATAAEEARISTCRGRLRRR